MIIKPEAVTKDALFMKLKREGTNWRYRIFEKVSSAITSYISIKRASVSRRKIKANATLLCFNTLNTLIRCILITYNLVLANHYSADRQAFQVGGAVTHLLCNPDMCYILRFGTKHERGGGVNGDNIGTGYQGL